ncbi:MAG: hypothetical protein ACTHYJ_10545 [Brevibacterium yomogidense]|uniref:Uncharacterized protein n=1 Tax=Brevibacterium yomogidense TaxID=946573 RepID=A0A1X6WZF7_9MICO|nr:MULTISPECIES: hypothetical protein [Brevibacterium]SLM91372.1 hypothetical protein FM105_02635 [Brevibacterium yomogidense]SMX78613.1 hypothetical protein BSP109_01476 [Brevibacterium sp. Mu109]
MAHEGTIVPIAEGRATPVGRTALWWCLGLGVGMVAGELVSLLTLGVMGLPDAAQASPLVAATLALWPWGLAVAAGALLLAGMRPAARLEIDRRTAAHIRRTGAPAIAKVMRASDPTPGPRAGLDATLLIRTSTGRMFSTDVHWTLDPVDAGSVRKRSVLPVRLDPSAPRRAVLDTQADSRAFAPGVDLDTAFSARRRLRQMVQRTRWSSRIALLVGGLAGLLLVTV